MKKTFVCLALTLVALPLLAGCARYAKISPEAYQYTKALYSVCNRKDEPRLEQVAQQIESARAESKITAEEADCIGEIIADAQAGDWQVATQDARQLMEAQVEGR